MSEKRRVNKSPCCITLRKSSQNNGPLEHILTNNQLIPDVDLFLDISIGECNTVLSAYTLYNTRSLIQEIDKWTENFDSYQPLRTEQADIV